MSRSAANLGVATSAAVVHDVALLVAAFYAPIFWGGFNTSGQALISAVVGIALAAALIAFWAQGRAPVRAPNAIHLPAVAFLGISCISAFSSVSWHASLLEVCRLGLGVVLLWLVGNRALLPAARPQVVAAALACSVVLVAFIPVPDETGLALKLFCAIGLGVTCVLIGSDQEKADPIRWLWWALVVSAAFVVALYGVREKFITWRLLDNPTWPIFSTFFNPNPLAGFFAMMFPLAVSAAVGAALLWRRLLWGFCALALVGAIVPTYSKGGWLALAAAVCCYVVLAGWASRRARRAMGVAAAALALGVIAFGGAAVVSRPVRERAASVVGVQSASNMFRILTWKGTIDLASAYRWLGVGPGGFKYAYPKYATAGYVEAAHQNYLQVFAEQGVFGGAIFLWLMGAVLFTGRRALARATGGRERALVIGALCSVVALLVHSLFDYDWYIGAIGVTFWLMAGMLAYQAYGRLPEGEPERAGAARGRRRGRERRRPASGGEGGGDVGSGAPGDEKAGRPVPWPSSSGGRAAAVLGVVVFLALCTWGLTRAALAENAVTRAETLVMSQRVESGLYAYEEATRYDPGLADAWDGYGMWTLLVGLRYAQDDAARRAAIEEGVDAFERAMALEPTDFKHWSALGTVYREVGEPAEAVRYYREALERFPKQTKTLRLLGETYQMLGEEESAREVYRRMVELEGSAFNRYRALENDVDVEYAYTHYQLGRLAARDHEAGKREDGLVAALLEFNEALRVIQDYFVRAEAQDRMFRDARSPREYRGDAMRELEAKVRWRMADACEGLGEGARAEAERKAAKAWAPQVADAIAAEDGGGRQ
jgi:O-antigen ligase/tetratricopeptide (TPR) repeat protein